MRTTLAQARLILRHDLRLLWRDVLAGRLGEYVSGALFVVLFLIANAITIPLFFLLHGRPPLAAETLAWLFFGLLMLSAAMNHAIRVLFERSDFDLLLSAPVSPRAVLLARTAAMSAAAALMVLMFIPPLLNGALLAVSPRYLAGYLVWLLLAFAVSSAGVWFTLVLVKWLGPRRARVWAQVAAAALGASVYLLTQSQSFIRDNRRSEFFAAAMRLLHQPWLSFVARAGRGEFLPLLALAAIAIGLTAGTTRLLARTFIDGVQEGNAIAPGKRRRPSRRRAFTASVGRATFWKDVRLIARDPLLLAQVLPSALYILPAAFGMAEVGGLKLLGPLALVLATQFSITLTAVCASGEECWDLIRLSPTPELRLRLAKMAAGMALPVIVSFTLCAILAAIGHPVLALLGVVYSFGCAAAGAWLQVVRIKPTPRRDVLKRGRHGYNIVGSLVAIAIMFTGAVGLGLAGSTHWVAATVVLGVTALAVAGCFTLVGFEEVASREFTPPPSAG